MKNFLPFFALAATSCAAQTPVSPVSRGLLVSNDFNAARWPQSAGASQGVKAQISMKNVGSIDSYKGNPSGALVLAADFSGAKKAARASLSSGVLEWKNSETNLGKITLAFDAFPTVLHPIRVEIRALDAKEQVRGSRFAVLNPPVAGAWFRFTLDWDKTAPLKGDFDPTAPKIQVVWHLSDEDGALPRNVQELRIDNVSLSVPALYVSPTGSDQNDGKTEKTALKTVKKAVDLAVPGDVISLLDGTFQDVWQIATITKKGAPAAWLTLRANPGARPELRSQGWDVIKWEKDAAYWEVRGLSIRGFRPDLTLEDALADSKITEKDGKKYWGSPTFNGNGLSVFDRSQPADARPHHFRFLDNDVWDNAGGGINAINCDYVTIQGNRVRDNCHWMRFGGSGISVFRSWNFDSEKGYKIFVLDNVSNGNRCFVPWGVVGHISDGNGIIIDDNKSQQKDASKIPYEGRTLVQNNLIFGNGGSGAHAYASRFVDFVNNTAYHNAQSPELMWSQIWGGDRCDDIRLWNNVMVAPKGKPIDLSMTQRSTGVIYSNNILFGDGDNAGASSGGLGTGEVKAKGDLKGNTWADPKFVAPSLDAKIADFRLQTGSPAIDAGSLEAPGHPLTDLLGQKRPLGKAPDAGAYEMK